MVAVVGGQASLILYLQATFGIELLPRGGLLGVGGTPVLVAAGSILAFSLALTYSWEVLPGRRPPLPPEKALIFGSILSLIFNSVLLLPYLLSSNVLIRAVSFLGSTAESLSSMEAGARYAIFEILSAMITALVAWLLALRRTQRVKR